MIKTRLKSIGGLTHLEEETDSFFGGADDSGFTFGNYQKNKMAPEPTVIPVGLRRYADFEMVWADYIKGASTGDLMICHGDGVISTGIIKLEGALDFSHIGIILKLVGKDGRFFLWCLSPLETLKALI